MPETRRTMRMGETRRARLRLCAGLGVAVLLAALCGLTSRSQSSGSNGGGGGGQGGGQGGGNIHSYGPHSDVSSLTDDDVDTPMDQRRFHALNVQRQKQMVSDADKLLKLAKELNDEVAAQNTGTFTSDELHKIGDIEKLARNVRQRMTEAAGPPQSTMPSPAPILFPTH
jgi:hypothetical protein